jgi:hypothetical protein
LGGVEGQIAYLSTIEIDSPPRGHGVAKESLREQAEPAGEKCGGTSFPQDLNTHVSLDGCAGAEPVRVRTCEIRRQRLKPYSFGNTVGSSGRHTDPEAPDCKRKTDHQGGMMKVRFSD